MATTQEFPTNVSNRALNHLEQHSAVKLPSREQQAHKLWADSCIELQRIEKMLAPAFERHQKALDACAEYGSENRLRMNPYMQEAWMTWEAKQLAAAERAKGK